MFLQLYWQRLALATPRSRVQFPGNAGADQIYSLNSKLPNAEYIMTECFWMDTLSNSSMDIKVKNKYVKKIKKIKKSLLCISLIP